MPREENGIYLPPGVLLPAGPHASSAVRAFQYLADLSGQIEATVAIDGGDRIVLTLTARVKDD